MKKKDKNGFINIIGSEGKELFQSLPIAPVNPQFIDEFKIRKKYIYRFKQDHQLIKIHENLLNNFLTKIPLNDAAIAFRKGKSYLNFIEPHRRSYHFMRLDLKSFFHSINEDLLEECFKSYFENLHFDEQKTQKLIQSFINIVSYKVPASSKNDTYKNKVILPIGFKTSPSISNIIFRKLDLLIQNYCFTHDIVYTRYADDMLFSSGKLSEFIHSDSFYSEIKYLISLDGFKLNKVKTIKSTHTISLNGYIIENSKNKEDPASIRVSNKKTYKIEKLIHEIKAGKTNVEIMTKLYGFSISRKYFLYLPPKPKFVEQYCKDQLLNKMLGYRSYLISILNFNNKFKCVNTLAIDKYSKIIDVLNKKINIYEG